MTNRCQRLYTAAETALIKLEWARLCRLSPLNKCISISQKIDRKPHCILAKAERMGLHQPSSVRHAVAARMEESRQDWGQRILDERRAAKQAEG